MLKFDDELELEEPPNPGTEAQDDPPVVLVAEGPFEGKKADMVELCAWVYQRGNENDAAATEMTTGHEHHELTHGGHLDIVEGPPGRWRMQLRQVGNKPLKAGDAFGVAVAMIKPAKEGGRQRVVWWGHPINLIEKGSGP
jgi:hypothetical protein